MKVYMISGLGADERVFYKLKLLKGYDPVFLGWQKPQAGETFEDYALKLAEGINSSEPFVLLGVSMGGMIASELSLKLHPAKTILISSYPDNSCFPPLFNWARDTRAYRFVPPSWFKHGSVAKRIFTAEEPEDKKLIKQQIKDCDNDFLKWSIPAILNWQRREPGENIIRIHGARDEVLPLKGKKDGVYIIPKAGHMMILTHAAEINKILHDLLT